MDDVTRKKSLLPLGLGGGRAADAITGYHAHFYYDGETKQAAGHIRRAIDAKFDVQLGRWRDKINTLHSKSFYLIDFTTADFADIVPWLALNRHGVSILIHPKTGDAYADHTDHVMWLGEPVDIDTDSLR